MIALTPEQLLKAMKAINKGDREAAHIDADDLLCETLKALGYGQALKVYDDMDKWYA